MNIILANPRGFCAGVDRAIEITNKALDIFGAPVYVKHEIVHNKYVVDELKDKGVIFIEDVKTIPEHSILIYSAHGVSEKIIKESKERKLKIFNATCPLVTKVHMEVARLSKKNINTILIGHKGHPEVEGTLGRYISDLDSKIILIENEIDVEKLSFNINKEVAYVTQTTLSIDDTANIIKAIKDKYKKVIEPSRGDICYATTNRQNAVKDLTLKCDVIFVVGSENSSNSNRLKEISTRSGVPSYLLDSADDLDVKWLSNKKNIGLTAGASAPEILVQSIINKLKAYGAINVINATGVEESITFKIPKELVTKN
jgi:4-hydroxy-3-methylbut-2-en-1-yl diphosphate reductase